MGRPSCHTGKKYKRAEGSRADNKINVDREKLRASILDGFRAKSKLPGKGGALLVAQGGVVSPGVSKCCKIEPKIAAACKDFDQQKLHDSGMDEASKVQRRKTRSERNRGRFNSKPEIRQNKAESSKSEKMTFKNHLALAEKMSRKQADPGCCVITQNRLTHRLGLFNQGRTSSTVTRESVVSHDGNRTPTPFSITPKSIGNKENCAPSTRSSCLSSCCHMSEEEAPFPQSPDVMNIAQNLLSDLEQDKNHSYLHETHKSLYQLLIHNAPESPLLKKTPLGQTPASQTYSHMPLSSATVKRSLFEDKTPIEQSNSAPTPSNWRQSPQNLPLEYMDARSLLQLNDEMLERSFSQQDDAVYVNHSFNEERNHLHDHADISFVDNFSEIENGGVPQEQYVESHYAMVQPMPKYSNYESRGNEDMDILDCIDLKTPDADVQPGRSEETDPFLDDLPWCPLANMGFHNPPSYSPSPRRIFRPRKVF